MGIRWGVSTPGFGIGRKLVRTSRATIGRCQVCPVAGFEVISSAIQHLSEWRGYSGRIVSLARQQYQAAALRKGR